jgi:hypothetical protein
MSGAEPEPWPVGPWKWDEAAKRLLRGIRDHASRELAEAAKAESETADHILIEGGRADLDESAQGLFMMLDRLGEPERTRAYNLLYHVMRGSYDIGAYSVIPMSASKLICDWHETQTRKSQNMQAAFMRSRRAKKRAPEKSALEQAIAEADAGRPKPSLKKLARQLEKRTDLPKVSLSTIKRVRAKLGREG